MSRCVTEDCHALEVTEATLRLVRLSTRARSVGLLMARGEALTLVLSDGIDQRMLDEVAKLWPDPPARQAEGEALWKPGEPSYLMLPCMVGATLSGFACLEMVPALPPPRRLQMFAQIVGAAVEAMAEDMARAGAVLAHEERSVTPQPITDTADLATLLEQHNWNLSRVARFLGLSRGTIYKRLQRLGVGRQEIRSSRQRKRRRGHGSRVC